MAVHKNLLKQFYQIPDGAIKMTFKDEFDLADVQCKEKKLKDLEIKMADEKEPLKFVEIGENNYRILNKKTGRFHNLELEIDEVF